MSRREEERIYDANDSFDVNQLKLTAPTILSGGHHFMKYMIHDHPLYLQTGKCTTKQGIIKAGKRMYCDLVFTNEHESFIRWLENLEEYSQKYIYDHRSQWFETDLEMHDIENSFTSPLKLYKSGKYYLLRVNIPVRLGKCTLRVYDEDETVVDLESIRDTTQMYTILELQGIRCSARSFQIEIEMKQMMVLRPNNLFETCVISKGGEPRIGVIAAATTMHPVAKEEEASANTYTSLDTEPDHNKVTESDIVSSIEGGVEVSCDIPVVDTISTLDPPTKEEEYTGIGPEDIDDNVPNVVSIETPLNSFELRSSELEGVPPKNTSYSDMSIEDLPEEYDLDHTMLDDKDPPVYVRNRNDVYYEMYLAAKTKAQAARDLAIQSFLEAKRIQNLYHIQDPDSDQPGTDPSSSETWSLHLYLTDPQR